MRLTQVAPGVWTATAATWATLSTVVVADDGACLVVDPGITVQEVGALAAEIGSRGWRPVAGFSTHPHWDHVLWASALGDGPRWATAAAARTAGESRSQILAEADADAPGHDHRFTAVLTPLPDGVGELPWDGPRAVVVPYRAHCPGSAALLLPGAGVLVAGDMFSDTEVPFLDLDAPDPVGDHHAALARLESVADRHGVGVLVPGHGSVTDAAGLRRRLAADRAYLDALVAGAAVSDPRLADPWVAGEHERQVIWAGGGRRIG